MASRTAAARPRTAALAVLLIAAGALAQQQQQQQQQQRVVAAAAAAPAVGAGSPAWTAQQSQEGRVSYGSGADLSAVLAHTYRTPLDRILSSNVYTGSDARLRRVVNDLQNGKAITVLAVGGVATNGSDASQAGANDYFAQYITYLTNAFPSSSIKAVRHSAGVAPSSIVANCADKYLDDSADLVLVEIVPSDAYAMDNSVIYPVAPQGYEVLLRKVLEGSKKPAVILTQGLAPGTGNGTNPYYNTPEAPHYSALATYYNLPYVSLRNAAWDPSQSGPDATQNLALASAADGSTPLDAGHNSLADMLVYKTQQAAQDLALIPYGDYDTSSTNGDVSPAMYPQVRNTSESDVLSRAACGWVQALMGTSDCPGDLEGTCDADYSSYAAARTSWADRGLGSSSSGLSTGALIGIIVGAAVAGLLLVGLVAWLCVRARKRAAAEAAMPVKQQPSMYKGGQLSPAASGALSSSGADDAAMVVSEGGKGPVSPRSTSLTAIANAAAPVAQQPPV